MREKKQRSRNLVMVVHGPEIFDTGEVAWLMERIRPYRTIVAGVMARTAAEESCLPVEYDGAPPSRIIRNYDDPVVLANHGKTSKSGRIFGNIVASHLKNRGLIQVECSDKTVIVWDYGDRECARKLSDVTGFPMVDDESTPSGLPGERHIRGCIPGETVYVNGIIIGRATRDTVVLRNTGSGIEAVSGLKSKTHGIEKLTARGPVDLSTAWCKSGRIRSVPPAINAPSVSVGRVVVIDHCGHELYNRIGDDCCGVLAIGDDTTAVCGHICAHRGIPVLGIIDGDQDSIVPGALAPGSVVLEVLNGSDDEIGAVAAGLVAESRVPWDAWVDGILSALGNRVRVIIDLRQESHNEVR